MAAPGKWDFTIVQGSTFKRSIVMKDSAGSVVDLTGYEARLKAKELIDDTTTLFEWLSTGVSPVITITAGSGLVAIVIGSDITAAYDFDNGIFDLELYDGSTPPDVVRTHEGSTHLSKGVTN